MAYFNVLFRVGLEITYGCALCGKSSYLFRKTVICIVVEVCLLIEQVRKDICRSYCVMMRSEITGSVRRDCPVENVGFINMYSGGDAIITMAMWCEECIWQYFPKKI